MGKKKSWVTCVKRLFISESKTKSEKKWKNSRSLFKFRNYPAAIEAPARTVNDAEEQQKRAIAVATAAAAAAEAAIAAADAAAEVARLACFSRELRRQNNLQFTAATKIQNCYRRYLARQALSALKGVVSLQAVVRGELARRNLHLRRSRMVQEIEIPNSKGGTLGTTKLAQLKLRSAMKQAKTEGRRSFRFSHEKEKSRRDDLSSQNAHSFRAYMATTESARAKVRSSSTPNQRRLRLSESSQSCQESSPSKLSISSFTTQLIFNPS